MAITDKEQGVWNLDEVYNKINQGSIWEYGGFDPYSLWMWGGNASGQLGQNERGPGTSTSRSSPTQVPGGTWNNATMGRGYVVFGIKSDNTLWGWGHNSNGVLGQEDLVYRSSPTQIPGTNWKKVGVGEDHMICTKLDGTLWALGQGGDGQTGQNSTTAYSSPRQIGTDTDWDKAYANGSSSNAIKTDGTLWAWGGSGFGGLGLNNNTAYSSPMQVGTETTWNELVNSSKGFIATKTDGTLWMAGNNEFGCLGKGTQNDHQSSPIQVGAGTDWSLEENAITSSAQGNTLAVKTDGTLWTWGNNQWGQLGHNNRTAYSSPKQLGTRTTYDQVACSYFSTITTTTDGEAWTIGDNDRGELGRENASPSDGRSSPVQLPGTNWTGCQGSTDRNVIAFQNP